MPQRRIFLEVSKIKTELSKKDNEKNKVQNLLYEKINKKQYNVKKLSTENKELKGSVNRQKFLN